jgi:hypothetical protein
MKAKFKILIVLFTLSSMGYPFNSSAQKANSLSISEGGGSYKTGIGLRGGWVSGLTLKHFVSSNVAVEGIIGSRWRGFNLTGLYELHKRNALGISRLSWEYGIGGRLGFYDGKYYRTWKDNKYYNDRQYTVVSIVALLGLEYHFNEIPFTLGADIMPYFDLVGRGDGFIDGSVSLRYTF